MKKNLVLLILGLFGSMSTFAQSPSVCTTCQTISTDLMNRPLKEALKYTSVKLRLKKQMYLVDRDWNGTGPLIVNIGSSGNISGCVIRANLKYEGETVGCTNPDGSPRDIELSKNAVKLHSIIDSPFPGSTVNNDNLEIKTGLPIQLDEAMYKSDNIFQNYRAVTSLIQCTYNDSSTLGDLVNALSDYYDVVGSPETSAPTI